MNAFQKCRDISDAVPLYLPQQLYLKPLAQIDITVQLPQKLMGKTISNWELMEKLKSLLSPEEFAQLRVTKSTIENIKFEAELENRSQLKGVILKLDKKLIKLKEFQDLFTVRVREARFNTPTRHTWDSFFREAKDMNELKSGERPDTVHLSNLPIRWFVPYHLSGEEDLVPSEKIFYRMFEKFGRISHVDVPICDPYRNKMKSYISGLQTFSFDEKDFFEGYVQFKDYGGFTKAMDAFRGMKLVHKDEECEEIYAVKIKVDFDRSKHMSSASIRRREIVRERLIKKEKEKEEQMLRQKEDMLKKEAEERQKQVDLKNEKERRRREREERRKAKILAQLKMSETEEINDKIAKEEKKLLRAQRKLEAIRLVEELFRRIKNKQEIAVEPAHIGIQSTNDELARYKSSSELELKNRKDNLHRAIEGRVVLKAVLADQVKLRNDSSSSETSLSLDEDDSQRDKDLKSVPDGFSTNPYQGGTNWHSYNQHNNPYLSYVTPIYSQAGVHHSYYNNYRSVGRGPLRAGSSRGGNNYRRRNNYKRGRGRGIQYYPPELQEEYYRYFQKFLHEDDRSTRSYSRSRSRSRSYKRSRSYSRSRRSGSKSRRSRRSRSRSRSRSRRSYSRRGSGSMSRSRRSRSRHRTKSRTKSVRDRSRSRSTNSIDSSKFMSPNTLRNTRTKSWSESHERMDRMERSWSKSPIR